MSLKIKRIYTILVIVILFMGTVGPSFALALESPIQHQEVTKNNIPVERISGDDRYGTSIEIAKALKTELDFKKFNAVIVTTGENYADALSGSGLAAALNAPILLVNKGDNTKVFNFISKNIDTKDGMIYILGGNLAVTSSVESKLKSIMLNSKQVKRLKGEDKYETNLAILGELDRLAALESKGVSTGTNPGTTNNTNTSTTNPGTANNTNISTTTPGTVDKYYLDKSILICSGNGFADALSASSTGYPILLVDKKLNKTQIKYLKEHARKVKNIYLIGGELAVTPDVQTEVDNIKTSKRLAGANRFTTSLKIANTLFKKTATEAVIATGETYPDGLCGGVLAYTKKAPLLLSTVKSDSFRFAYQFVAKSTLIKKVTILGGKLVVSDDGAGLTSKGGKKTGLLKIGDRYYFSDSNADLVKDIIKTINNKKYYFTAKTGVAAKSEVFQKGKKWYGAKSDSTLANNGWTKTGKYSYFFNEDYTMHDVCVSAKKELDTIGWDLRKAYDWIAKTFTYISFNSNPAWGSFWFASYGLKFKKGGCTVCASTFYLFAKMLNYDVVQVQGYIRGLQKDRIQHSWTFITHKGEKWIYDPQFWMQHPERKPAFKIKNGDSIWYYHPDIKQMKDLPTS